MNPYSFRIFYNSALRPLIEFLQSQIHLRVEWVEFSESTRSLWESDEYAIRILTDEAFDHYPNYILLSFVEQPHLNFEPNSVQLYRDDTDPTKMAYNAHLLVCSIQQKVMALQEKAMLSEKRILNEMIEQEVEQRLDSLANEHLFYRKQQEARALLLSEISHLITSAYRRLEGNVTSENSSEVNKSTNLLLKAINSWNEGIGKNHKLMDASLRSTSLRKMLKKWESPSFLLPGIDQIKLEEVSGRDCDVLLDFNYFTFALSELLSMSGEELGGQLIISFKIQKLDAQVQLEIDGLDPSIDDHASFGVIKRLFTHAGCEDIYLDPDYRLILTFQQVQNKQQLQDHFKTEIQNHTRGLKALAADDNDINLLVNVTLLTDLGFDVVEAANGEKAKELIQDQAFDFYLLDIRMPYADGFEVARFAKETYPQKNAKGILCTAYPDEVDRSKLADIGIQDVIEKPLNEKSLLKSLSKLYL